MPVDDKIKVFDAEDNKLKLLGELLSNDTSRKIIRMLIGKECYTNEISTKLDIRVSLVIHHLKKLEQLGVLEINHKQIVKKGNNHRYFRMMPGLFLAPNQTKEEIEESGFLKKIFREGIKFATIGFVSIFSWFVLTINESSKWKSAEATVEKLDYEYIVPLIVIIIFLLILYFKKEKKG